MPQVFALDTGHKHALHGLSWPHESPRAVLALIHGHGEHIGRYGHVADALHANDIAMLGYDLIGHGESPGKRGHFPNYDAVLDSIGAMVDKAKADFPEVPVFLMGHSMGGNLVANYVLRRGVDIAGVILSSPWLELAFAPSALDLTLANVMKGILPSFTQSSKLDATAISRDAEEVRRYQQDAKIHDKVSPGLFLPIVEGGTYALDHASAWSLPLLIQHGSGDRITSFEASKRFAEAISGEVTFRAWEGGYHELHNDLEREQVIQAMVDWIVTQVA